MTLSISTLAAIQKVGAAAFQADAKLKAAAQDYAERVSAAITESPDKQGTDALIENWRAVARLSRTLEGIEEELKKVYQAASQLTSDDQLTVNAMPVPAKPTRATGKGKQKVIKTAITAAAALPDVAQKNSARQVELSAIDVVAKPKKKAALPKVKAKAGKRKVAAKTMAPTSNPERLLQHLQGLLNTSEFTAISQTGAAKETGIPMGSMTAAIKKLAQTARVVIGPNGSLKLTAVQPELPATSPLPLAA